MQDPNSATIQQSPMYFPPAPAADPAARNAGLEPTLAVSSIGATLPLDPPSAHSGISRLTPQDPGAQHASNSELTGRSPYRIRKAPTTVARAESALAGIRARQEYRRKAV